MNISVRWMLFHIHSVIYTVWSTSRISLWADPFSALHGGSDQDRVDSRPASSPIWWWHSDIQGGPKKLHTVFVVITLSTLNNFS